MAEITIGQTITTQQYADTVDESLPYSHNAFLFYVDVTLISQDEVNATSRITIRHRLKCIRSYWSNYSNIYGEIAIGTDVKDTKHLATTELGKTYTLGTWTGDVAHDEDGELTITVNGNWYGDYGSSRYSPENNVLTNIIDFPAIQRVSKLSVTPATLTSGNLSISITKYVSTYTTTVKYKVEGTEYTLATNSADTSFSLSFNALKALIGSFTSSVVEITAITYDNDYEIGSDRKSIIVQTGKIPLSLYDNRQGSVGVTFGEEATGAGFNVKMEAQFDKSVKGMAYGLGALPRISSGDDFNNYLTPGMWAVVSNSGAGNITNCPVAIGGILQVFDGRGQYPYTTYLMQRYLPSSISTGNYVRVVRDITTTPVFGNWVIEATMTGSDRKIKKDIRSLTIDYENLFNKLNPITYKYRVSYTRVDDTTHFGFIAQDVEQAINEVGLTDLALINVEDDNYSLNYQEFIALNTHMIQKLYGIVEEQQIKINELENRLEELVNG
jgi:hypothetical protein